MMEFDIFYSPWGGQTDYFLNILCFVMLILLIFLFILLALKKIKLIRFLMIASFAATSSINCFPIILFNWFMAVTIIISQSIIFWFSYSASIDIYARRQLKNIELTNRLLMEKLEDEYDSSHAKEELEVIKRQAHKYPRIRITKFLFISFITPILFFITLLLMGYKHIP